MSIILRVALYNMAVKSNQIALVIEILRLLAQKERSRQELADLLSEFLDARAEPMGDTMQKLDRAMRKLRNCGFEISGGPNRLYKLEKTHFPVILTSEQKNALSLAASLLDNLEFSREAAQIRSIDESLEYQESGEIITNFNPPVNYSDRQITETLQRLKERIREQLRFTINYTSAQGKTNFWDLDRSELRLHDGIIYLFSYVPTLPYIDKNQKDPVENNRMFRIDRIDKVNPASTVSWFSQFPTLDIRYRLTGALGKHQPRRPQEQIIEQNRENNFVIIKTKEDCLFWFRQRIMKYGANAEILTPEWLRQKMGQEFKRAYDKYAL